MVEEKEKCTICSGNLKPLVARKDVYHYYKCDKCALVTTIPQPDDATIAAYYNGFLFRKPEGEEVTKRKKALAKDVASIVKDIQVYKADKGLKLLDFGGGTGFYSNAFQQAGYEVTLLDVDEQACAYVETTFPDLKIVCVNPMEHRPKEKYDIVFCNQVIEHYKDSDQLLNTLHALLAEDGLLIVTTPNAQSKEYWFRPAWIWDYVKPTSDRFAKRMINAVKLSFNSWLCCDPPRHIYAFNSANLGQLHQRNNLEVLNSFTEYVSSQYYSLKKHNDFSFRGLRSIVKIFLNLYAIAGIRLLRFFDRKNKWGNNLVIYSRKKK